MKLDSILEKSIKVIDLKDGTIKAKIKTGDIYYWKHYQSFTCPVCNSTGYSIYTYYHKNTNKGPITCSQQCRDNINFAIKNNIPIEEYLNS